jgi:hypothetical protein
MMRHVHSLLILFVSLVLTGEANAHAPNDSLYAVLSSPFFEKLYANTYYNLLDRMGKDGYLPESLSGAYEGMYWMPLPKMTWKGCPM